MTSVQVSYVCNSASVNPYVANALATNMYILGVAHVKSNSPTTFDNHPISIARDLACKEFLAGDKEWLFFLDSDVVLKPDTIFNLLQFNEPIVSGWYLSRKGTGLPVALKDVSKKNPLMCKFPPKIFPAHQSYRLNELCSLPKDEKGLVNVDAVGAGCLLIHRSVLEKLSQPFFKEYWNENDNETGHQYGEDLYFSLNVRSHGLNIKIDLNNFVGHIAWAVLDTSYLKRFIK